MDPSSGMWARALDSVKSWPLWLLGAISALARRPMFAVPDFRALASPTTATALVYAVIVAWIFVLARAAKPVTEAVLTYLHYREQSRYFLVTAIEGQCHWGVSKQPDGSYLTQVAVHCMVKNRSTTPVHLMKARVIKPKIRGEVLPGLVVTRSAECECLWHPARLRQLHRSRRKRFRQAARFWFGECLGKGRAPCRRRLNLKMQMGTASASKSC